MKRLLLVFTENPKKIGQALNCLGNNIDITVFLPECGYNLYDMKNIRFDKKGFVENPDYYIEMINELYYDEIYFLLDDIEVVGINPQEIISKFKYKEVFFILNDKLPCKTIKQAQLFDNVEWVLPQRTKGSI